MKKQFFERSLALGIIWLLILASLPITFGKNIEKTKEEILTNDEPYLIVDLPDAHVYYHFNKFGWGRVEFEDPGAIIDVNLSGFEEDKPLVGFDQNVYIHVKGQILPSLVGWTLYLLDGGIGVTGAKSFYFIGRGADRLWNATFTCHFTRFDKENEGYFTINVTLTGVPRRLSWLVFFSLVFDMFYPIFDPSELLPYEKRHGHSVEYLLHVHT